MKLTPQQLINELSKAEFVYQGFVLYHETDYEEDNIKLWHNVITPQCELIYVDWTPYARMSETDFIRWIKLGMPGRLSWGPLHSNDLTVLEQRAKVSV